MRYNFLYPKVAGMTNIGLPIIILVFLTCSYWNTLYLFCHDMITDDNVVCRWLNNWAGLHRKWQINLRVHIITNCPPPNNSKSWKKNVWENVLCVLQSMQGDVIYMNGETDEGMNQWMERGTGERRERESGRQIMEKWSSSDSLVCNVRHNQPFGKILLTH